MEVRLLGALEVSDDEGQPVAVAGGRQRTLLALLALRPGAVVSTERLIDDLWGDRAPQGPGNALQVAVFKLRRTLGGDVIVTRPPGYALAIADDDVDALRFERLVQEGRAALEEGRAGTAVGSFDAALGLWRGDALVEFGDVPTLMAAASRLEELRAATREDRFDALLAMGRDADLVPDLDAAITAAPFRERLRGQLMLALYRSGRQADALRAFGDARRVLADELGLDPGPELSRLEAAILSQDPALELAPRSRVVVRETDGGSGPPTNLRPSLTSFVGRGRDVAGVSELLAAHRLVTLVGAGGSGKTRLACEVAPGRIASFPDGVWFVALDSTTTGDGVAATVAGALGLSTSDTAGQPELATMSSLDRIRGALADRIALVVLDNCEHVIDAAAQLTVELLGSAPGLRVLATSREALRVPGEMVWTVPPLDTDDAVTLFTERARAAGADLDLSASDRSVLADLCERLDGMPLAIELTAARSNAFTVTQLAERLDDRFRLLTGGSRTALPRQQTLRAVTDWSYDLLFEHEQSVFERLSVFAGGCTLEAAEAVCSDDHLPPADVGDIVGRLVDKSLLVNDGAGRYRLLLTLAQYGRERLTGRDDGEAVRDRHAAYYRGLAELSFVDWRTPQGRNLVWWMGHLTEELDNLRAALEWSIARGDGATAQATAGFTGWFWWHSGRADEGYRWLERALACSALTPPEVRAPAATWAACVALEAGHTDVAAQRVAQAIELNDVHGDRAMQGMAGVVAARLALLAGAVDLAVTHLDRAQQAHQRLGGAWGEGISASVRAFAATLRGDLDTAERENLFSIDRLRTVGDVASLVLVLDQQSRLLLSTGRSAEAESIVREARDVSASHGMRGWESTMSTRLGSLALARGDLDAAGEQFKIAAALARDLAFPAAEAPAIDGLGLVHRHRGELAEAARCHQAARAVAARCDTMANVVLSTAHLGHVAEAAGDLDEARRLYGEVFAMARRFDDDRAAALALEGLAGVVAAAGDGELAAMLLGYATHLRASVGDTMQGDERFDVELAERSARALLGDDEFQRAHEAGRRHDDVEALLARIELTTAS